MNVGVIEGAWYLIVQASTLSIPVSAALLFQGYPPDMIHLNYRLLTLELLASARSRRRKPSNSQLSPWLPANSCPGPSCPVPSVVSGWQALQHWW